MKVLLDIKDNKALHILEVLTGLSYVKILVIYDLKAELLSEIREAVEEMNQFRAGKKQAHDAKNLLNEL